MRRGLARTAVFALTLVTVPVGAVLLRAQPVMAASSNTPMSLEVTFYGAPDNDPPGGSIAHPVLHGKAGGTGTYSDPVTFATDVSEFGVGTRIYYAPLRKYFMMEDDCVQCIADWQGGKYHVDLWTGYDSGILACERSLTPANGQIVLRPTSNLPVDTTPIYSGGRCQGQSSGGVPQPVEEPKPAPKPSPSPSPSVSASPSASASPSPSASVSATPTTSVSNVALDAELEAPSGQPSQTVLADVDPKASPSAAIVGGPGVVLLLLGGGSLFLARRLRRRH